MILVHPLVLVAAVVVWLALIVFVLALCRVAAANDEHIPDDESAANR